MTIQNDKTMKRPEIRLADFVNEWEYKTFGNLGYSYSGLTGKGKNDFGHGEAQYITFLNVLTNSHIKPDMFQKVDVKSGENQNSVVKGDLLFNTSSETPEEVGMCSVLDFDIPNLYLNSFCFGFRLTDESVLPSYMVYQMRSGAGRKLMKLLAQGATRHNLPKKELYKSLIAIPQTTEEQLSIANFFKRLEDLIEINRNKIESLKQLKSASLVSMFPQAGETKPRVRFKGFEGDWAVSNLGSISQKVLTKNKNLAYRITLTNSAEYGIINQLDFFDHDISNASNISSYYVVENDDFVYNPRISATAPVGPINRNELGYAGVMSPLYFVFKVTGIDKDYLSWFFKTTLWHKFMKDNGNTGARFDRLSIKDDVFLQMPIVHPVDETEQRCVARFFQNLNQQISTQEQRLEKLKQIKSACLNKMFV